jgi:hypothetical protein
MNPLEDFFCKILRPAERRMMGNHDLESVHVFHFHCRIDLPRLLAAAFKSYPGVKMGTTKSKKERTGEENNTDAVVIVIGRDRFCFHEDGEIIVRERLRHQARYLPEIQSLAEVRGKALASIHDELWQSLPGHWHPQLVQQQAQVLLEQQQHLRDWQQLQLRQLQVSVMLQQQEIHRLQWYQKRHQTFMLRQAAKDRLRLRLQQHQYLHQQRQQLLLQHVNLLQQPPPPPPPQLLQLQRSNMWRPWISNADKDAAEAQPPLPPPPPSPPSPLSQPTSPFELRLEESEDEMVINSVAPISDVLIKEELWIDD